LIIEIAVVGHTIGISQRYRAGPDCCVGNSTLSSSGHLAIPSEKSMRNNSK